MPRLASAAAIAAAFASAAALTSACSAGVEVAGADGGAEIGRDAGAASGTDASSGAQGDAAAPAGADAGIPAGPGDAGSGAGADAGGSAAATLAERYPRDLGIENDPAVVWAEDFEEGSVAAVVARYDDYKNQQGMALAPDVPADSGGQASLKLTAGVSHNATDLYKLLPGGNEWFVRWYAKYQAGIHWHHTGVWFGGYRPPTPWPSPQAGLKPDGDDRFSIAIEPVWGVATASPRLDTYNYWMRMRSWMDQPSGNGAYWGNAVIHQNGFTLDEGRWMCLEVHLRLNDDLGSAQGAVLEVWKDDVLVRRFDQAGPLGYWIRDKFCPEGADGKECTDYPAPADTVLDLQMRTTSELELSYFWPQSYITEGPDGSVLYDDMVVATERVGCLRP